MRRVLYALLVLFLATVLGQEVSGEDKAREKAIQGAVAKGRDTTQTFGWTPSLTSGLNLTQVAFADWAPGGENALSYAVSIVGGATHNAEETIWSNKTKLAFGQTRLGNQGIRKTDDEIHIESLLIYYPGSVVNPYASATLRTQFAPGFQYANDGTRTEVSRFFDPAFLTQSVGAAWQPSSPLTVRVGVALREVVTSRFTGYADDPGTPGVEKTRVQGGPESVVTLEWPFAENMKLSSRLELFAPFSDIDRVIVRNDNLVIAAVNRYLNVSLSLQLINDINVSPRTQIKETLAFGFSYNVL